MIPKKQAKPEAGISGWAKRKELCVQTQSTPSQATGQATKPARRKRRRKKRARKSRQGIGSFPLAFGKYARKPISSVSISYLKWAVTTPGIPVTDKWVIQQFLKAEEVTV